MRCRTKSNLVEQFADKPVNLVWISTEKEETLAPLLKTHPVRGWMVLDPQERSFKAYGIEGAGDVLIGPTEKSSASPPWILHRTRFSGGLDHHAVAVHGEATELHLPLINDIGLKGYYDFKMKGEAQTTEQFLKTMREQLGLVPTLTQHKIEITAVRAIE